MPSLSFYLYYFQHILTRDQNIGYQLLIRNPLNQRNELFHLYLLQHLYEFKISYRCLKPTIGLVIANGPVIIQSNAFLIAEHALSSIVDPLVSTIIGNISHSNHNLESNFNFPDTLIR